MNRFERRKAESIKRKVRALPPAARELAIQTGMELHDALAEERSEKRKQEIQSLVEKEWASRYDKLYKQVSEEQANRFTDRVAEVDRKAREHLSDLVRWRQAYLATYVAWLAAGGSPEPQGRLTSMEAIEAVAHEFKVRLAIIENRVEKDAGHFSQVTRTLARSSGPDAGIGSHLDTADLSMPPVWPMTPWLNRAALPRSSARPAARRRGGRHQPPTRIQEVATAASRRPHQQHPSSSAFAPKRNIAKTKSAKRRPAGSSGSRRQRVALRRVGDVAT